MRRAKSLGFTLLELVLVIVLVGILAALTSDIILRPFQAFQDQARRAQLVSEADAAMTRMVRELRHALPNSVRVGDGGRSLEFIPTIDGGRYRASKDLTTTPPGGDILDFTQPDDSFDVLGGLLAEEAKAQDHVVIYNTGSGTTDAYSGGNRATIRSVTNNSISISPTQFPHPSLDAQRFFIVPQTGPVTYYCQGAELRRHTGYGFQPAAPNFTGVGALLAEHVSTCQFDYESGDNVRNGVVTVRLGLKDEGETITLLYQAQVVNAP